MTTSRPLIDFKTHAQPGCIAAARAERRCQDYLFRQGHGWPPVPASVAAPTIRRELSFDEAIERLHHERRVAVASRIITVDGTRHALVAGTHVTLKETPLMRPDPNPHYTPTPTVALGTLREVLAYAERLRNDCSKFLDINRDTFLTLDTEIHKHDSEIARLKARIAEAERVESIAKVVHLARVFHRYDNLEGVLIIGAVQQTYMAHAGYPTRPYTVVTAMGGGCSYATREALLQQWNLA